MTGSTIVNNLAGLMMLTSLFVISVKSYRLSCGFYACQSLVLVSIFATLSCLFAAEQLLIWSASAFITKVLLVPLIMTYAARNIPQNIPEKALFGPAMMALLAALIVLLCAFVVQPVKLPMATGLKPALAVALGHFLLGLLCIVSQRNILRQIFGYCLMENGSHLVLALLAWRAPELVEIGIATDAIFAVIVMVLLALWLVQTAAGAGEIFAAGLWLHIDGLGGLFLAILGVIGFLTGVYSIGYMRHEVAHGELSPVTLCDYYGFFHLFLFTMLLVVTSNNLIVMWAAIEATTLSSAFLVGIYGQRSSLEAAWKYIIICTVGVAFGLFGTVLVYANAASVMPQAEMAIFWSEVLKQ